MKKLMTGLLLIIAFTYFSNNAIQITPYTLVTGKWPEALNGYKIVHLADLQSKVYGNNQKNLLKLIEQEKPDLIVFTGDLIDRRHYAKQPAIDLMKGCKNIAPTAFVTGNHEIWHGSANSLKSELNDIGIMVLDNKSVQITDKGVSFTLIGLADRADFPSQSAYEQTLQHLTRTNSAEGKLTFISKVDQTTTLSKGTIFSSLTTEPYQILISHRPEQFPVYRSASIDLSLAGHSHGGQIRLPFLGGLIAPDQGILPEFDGGIYTEDTSTMIVSRGLGNSIFPVRVFNRPEIPVIVLQSK